MTAEHHPSDVMLLAFAAGALDEAQRLAVALHVSGCARCRAFVDAMEHVGGIMLESLPPTPLAEASLGKVLARLEQLAPPSAVAPRARASDHHVMLGSRREERRGWFGHWRGIIPRTRMANAALIGDFAGRGRWFGHWIAPGQRLRTGLAGAALILLSLGITYLAAEYTFFRYADDYAAATATTGRVAIAGSTTGRIEIPGDVDWHKITLTSGKTYRFHLEGSDTGQGTLQYPVLRLRDSTGQVLHSDSGSIDGAGPGWTSVLTYTAASTGTYHVSCEASGKQTGTYKLSATEL